MFNRFTELHVHSEYSMRDGANKVEKLIDRAIELGIPIWQEEEFLDKIKD